MSALFKRYWVFLISLGVFSFLILTNPFSSRHVMRNLEPYPDGLFYTIGAERLSLGEGFNLLYRDTSIRPKIPFAYSLVMAPFFVIEKNIPFYIANVALAFLSLWWLYWALQNISQKPEIQLISLLLFVLHGYIAWFVTLPMAENLGLCLMSGLLFLLTQKKVTHLSVFFIMLAAGALILTKYVYAPISVVACLWVLWKILQNRSWQLLSTFVGTGLSVGAVFLMFLLYVGFNPFSALAAMQVVDKPEMTFFSYSFSSVLTTLKYYGSSLIGVAQPVLWLRYPFSSLALSGAVVVLSSFYWWKYRTLPTPWGWLLALAGAPLAILIFFYVQDARYFLTAIPALCVVICMLLDALFKNKRWWWIASVGAILLVIQVMTQLHFFKFLISTNVLLRSRAWNYEATQIVPTYITQKDRTFLITALPPYLFEFYAQGPLPRLLPLAPDQEFLSKGNFIWGDDITYDNLIETYQTLIDQGNDVLVTNAYVTNTSVSIQAFEHIKKSFTLEQVGSGCEETCNVYRLRSRASSPLTPDKKL